MPLREQIKFKPTYIYVLITYIYVFYSVCASQFINVKLYFIRMSIKKTNTKTKKMLVAFKELLKTAG